MVILYAVRPRFQNDDISARMRIGQINRLAQRKFAVRRVHHIGDRRNVENGQQPPIFQRFEFANPAPTTHPNRLFLEHAVSRMQVMPLVCLITFSQTRQYPRAVPAAASRRADRSAARANRRRH